MQEATEAALRTLEGIAVNVASDFPLPPTKGRPAELRRQAKRMREALDAIREELDFYDPPNDLAEVMTAPPGVDFETRSSAPFDTERYRK